MACRAAHELPGLTAEAVDARPVRQQTTAGGEAGPALAAAPLPGRLNLRWRTARCAAQDSGDLGGGHLGPGSLPVRGRGRVDGRLDVPVPNSWGRPDEVQPRAEGKTVMSREAVQLPGVPPQPAQVLPEGARPVALAALARPQRRGLLQEGPDRGRRAEDSTPEVPQP